MSTISGTIEVTILGSISERIFLTISWTILSPIEGTIQ
jgi:hypothetical protein